MWRTNTLGEVVLFWLGGGLLSHLRRPPFLVFVLVFSEWPAKESRFFFFPPGTSLRKKGNSFGDGGLVVDL